MSEGSYSNPNAQGDAGMRLDADPETDPNHQFISDVHRWFQDARRDRARFDQSWDRWRRYALGDQWGTKIRAAWKAKPAPNYCFSTIETIIPIMTDGRPQINVVAAQPGKEDLADKMQGIVRRVFFVNRMEMKFPIVLRNAHWYGDGFVKVWYNALKDDIEITSVDTRNIFPSAGGVELQNCRRVIIAFNRWIESIEDDFPELKGKIKGGTWDDALTHLPVSTTKEKDGSDQGWVNTVDGTTGQTMMLDPYARTQGGNERMATQLEIWEKDRKGKVFVSVVVNGVVAIKDGVEQKRIPSPFHHRFYPIAQCRCYPVDSQLWSVSEMSQLENIQDSINRDEAQIADIKRMISSAQMLIPRGGRISLKDITNRLGGFIIHEDNKPPQWMPPPPFPGQIFQSQQNSIGHMDRVSGVYEAARGQRPVGTTSGVAIQSLQQATGGRIGLKTRMFECFLQDIAVQVIELSKQFYQDRTVRVSRNQYVQVNKWLPDKKQVDPKTDLSDTSFEVEIGVGSTLPVDKGIRFEQSKELFDRKALDRRTFLEDSGRSEEKVDEIMKRLEKEVVKDAKTEAVVQTIIQPPAPAGAPAGPAPQGGGAPMDEQAAAAAEGELSAPPAMPGEGVPTEEELAQIEAEMQ